MPYKVWAAGNVLSAADMTAITADPVTQDVTANEASASASYGNLTTTGPAVSLAMVSGQKATVTVSARIDSPLSIDEGFMSFEVTGTAGTLAAADVNAARLVGNATSAVGIISERTTVFTATATGTATFTAKYRRTGGSFIFRDRRIQAKKH